MRFIFIYEYTLSYFTRFRLKTRLGSAADQNQRFGSFFSKSPAFPTMNFSSAAAERDA